MNSVPAITVFAVLVTASTAVFAQPTFRQNIIVTAERIEQPSEERTAAVTVLTREELERLPATNLAEAIRFVPGLQLIDVTPGAPPMLSSRGFFGGGEVEYVQLLVDGVPVDDTESGLADWRQIPIDAIDRIEVLRGPGSSLFGDVALGGIVQVFRRRQTSSATLSAGSFDTVEGAISLGRDHMAAAARLVESAGFREHGDWRELFADVSIARQVGTGKLTLSIDAADRDRDEPGPRTAVEMRTDPFGSDALFSSDRESTRRARLAVTWDGHVSDVPLHAQVHAANRDGETIRTLLLAPGAGDRARRSLKTSRLGLSTRTQFETRKVRGTAGVELSSDSLDTSYGIAGGSGQRRRGALFLTTDFRLSSRARASAGVRWDLIDDWFETQSRRDSALSPRAAINVRIREGTHLYVQIARAFKAPTLDQRFDPRPLPDFAGGTFTISNPQLAPQQAAHYEAGVFGQSGRARWELVGYSMNVEDEIDFDFNTFRYQNIGRSRHRGLEASVAGEGSAIAPRLTYTWTRVKPMSGRQLKNIAEHVARAELALHEFGGVGLLLSAERAWGRFLDDANHFALGDPVIVDLRLSKAAGPAKIRIDVQNLTDELYAPLGFTLTGFDGAEQPFYFPAPGRSIRATLQWQFGTSSGGGT